MVRREILHTLKSNPDGLTAEQILRKMNPRQASKIRNAKHVSNLVRGMKGVRRGHKNSRIHIYDGMNKQGHYDVNTYYYDDEGAEI